MSTEREQREQYEYARGRILQKKRLMRHFVFFLAGSIVLIILDLGLGVGSEWPVKNWFAWAILLWFFFLLVHGINVLFVQTFMGKEWEDRQLEKLKSKQEKRLHDLQKRADAELLKESRKTPDKNTNTDPS